MRYIPDLTEQTFARISESQNSQINMRAFGAQGLGHVEFSGSITSATPEEIIISSITGEENKTIYDYVNNLKTGVELQAFVYRPTFVPQNTILTISSTIAEGVDFSSSTSNSPFLNPLRYYVWGYNMLTGSLPFAGQTIEVGTKILDPDRWNENQYVELRFSRADQFVVPIVYRAWGSRLDFLGVIGNEKVGFPGASVIAFRDLGLVEIPSWDTQPSTPSFLNGVIETVAGVPTQQKIIVGKELLKIAPAISGVQLNFIATTPANGQSFVNAETYLEGDSVRFVIDDTAPIRRAIDTASSGAIKEIFFPSGTYNFRDSSFTNTSSKTYSDITLRGIGESSVIKRLASSVLDSSQPGLLRFVGEPAVAPIDGLRLRDICFDGNSGSSFSSVTSSLPIQSAELLLNVQDARNISITGCKFQNTGGNGLFIKDSADIVLLGSAFSGSGRRYETPKSPLYIYGSENVVAQGNVFQSSTSGPYFFSTDFSTINNNIVRSCGDKGITLESSYQWNATNNLAYSDNDSLIQSIDQYNSSFFGAELEVTRGIPLAPVYFTVTEGGESVSLLKDSIEAEIFSRTTLGLKGAKVGNLRVLQTFDQLEAGIFSLTLPGSASTTVGGLTIPSTSSLQPLSPADQQYGYLYEVKASAKIGRSGQGFPPFSIRSLTIGSDNYVAIQLRNSSDVLSFQVYSASSPDNDKVIVSGFSNTNLGGFDQNTGYTVVDIDSDSNSILLNPIPTLSLTTDPIEFVGGSLFILRSNYLIAQGTIIVH